MTRGRGEPSAEFGLVAACCRWPTDVAAIRAAASAAPIDWPAAVRVSRRHRVIGFFRVGLMAAGIAVPLRIEELYAPMMRRNLLQYGEAVRLTALLGDAGIPVALLKGVVLAELAYGGQGVKHTIDNDLLVAPRDVPATFSILHEAGYRVIGLPDNDNPRPASLIDLINECQFLHPASGAILDLHWRLHAYKQVLGEPDVATETRVVMVEGKPLPTLTDEALMLYLAIHGTRHSWARLKWLADFNALLGRMDDSDVAALRALARRGGVAPCVDSALIQCERLLGARVPADVYRSRRARTLVRLSDGLIFGPDQHIASGRYARRWLLSTLVMNTRLRTAGSIFWHLWVSPIDMLTMPLPRPLHPLYLAISPVRRCGRIMRRVAARGFARARSGPMRAPQEK